MKYMNMKRFGSVAMAGAMALSLAAPAFAANEVTITGTYKEIPIAVTVPTTGTAQINPYGLPITLTKSDETTADIVGQKITSAPLSIKNQGTVDLDVKASLAVLPKGDVIIGTVADGKEIKVSLEVAGLDNEKYAVSTESEALEDLLIDAFADSTTWSSAEKLVAPDATKGATSVTPLKSDDAMATIGKATVAGDSITYGNDSIALFRLTGDLNEEPDDPWTTADGFTATIVFTFTPNTGTSNDGSSDSGDDSGD